MKKIISLFFIGFFCLLNSYASSKTNFGLFLKIKDFRSIRTILADTTVSALRVNSFRPTYQIVVPDSLRNKYAGTYRMTMDKIRTMEILKEENHLVAKYSKDLIFLLTPKSTTEFVVERVQPESVIKFIFEKGKVTRYIAYQNGPYEWKKIK